MPNILQPQPQEVAQQNSPINSEELTSAIGIKNLEFLQYLGKKDALFDSDVMQKVSALSDYFQDVDDLMETDITLGEKNGLTKLDKLYTYVLLSKQEEELRRKRDLIIQAKENVAS